MDFISQFEQKEVEQALIDERWSLAIQYELNQFIKKN